MGTEEGNGGRELMSVEIAMLQSRPIAPPSQSPPRPLSTARLHQLEDRQPAPLPPQRRRAAPVARELQPGAGGGTGGVGAAAGFYNVSVCALVESLSG